MLWRDQEGRGKLGAQAEALEEGAILLYGGEFGKLGPVFVQKVVGKGICDRFIIPIHDLQLGPVGLGHFLREQFLQKEQVKHNDHPVDEIWYRVMMMHEI